MNGVWFPIDTAPKDGTEILAHDGKRRRVVHWDEGGYIEGWFIQLDAEQRSGSFMQPTHWMPIAEMS